MVEINEQARKRAEEEWQQRENTVLGKKAEIQRKVKEL
jgi:hypothetical protein